MSHLSHLIGEEVSFGKKWASCCKSIVFEDSDSSIEVKLLDPMVKLATYIFHVLSRCITISYFHLVHR
ncbi:hypothetical protein Hanom_Chr15g01398071 [Helianthus anomalus]